MHVYDVKAIIHSISAYSGLAPKTIIYNPIWFNDRLNRREFSVQALPVSILTFRRIVLIQDQFLLTVNTLKVCLLCFWRHEFPLLVKLNKYGHAATEREIND